MNCPYPKCPYQGTQAEVDDHLTAIGTDVDHTWPSGEPVDPWPEDEDPPEAYSNGPGTTAALEPYSCTLHFQTSYVLTQDTAQAFWARGTRFHAAGGPRTYEWTTEVLAPSAENTVTHALTALGSLLADADIRKFAVLQIAVHKVQEEGKS